MSQDSYNHPGNKPPVVGSFPRSGSESRERNVQGDLFPWDLLDATIRSAQERRYEKRLNAAFMQMIQRSLC